MPFILSDDDKKKLSLVLGKKPTPPHGRTPLQGPIPTYLAQVGTIAGMSSSGGLSSAQATILSLNLSSTGSTGGSTGLSSTSGSTGYGMATTLNTGQTVTLYNQLATSITAGIYSIVREPISGQYILAWSNGPQSGSVQPVILLCDSPIAGPALGAGALNVYVAGALVSVAGTVQVYNFRANTTVTGHYYVGWPIAHTSSVFPISSVKAGTSGAFLVAGDVGTLTAGQPAFVYDSTNNNGTFGIVSASYSSGISTINVTGNVNAISPHATPGFIDVGPTIYVLDNQAAFI